MKTVFRMLVLVVVLAIAGTTVFAADDEPGAPYIPEFVPVEPTLLAAYEGFYPPEVLPVTDGVWVARGYNRDNPTLIEGSNGLIVIDPGESIEAGERVKAAFNAELDNIFDRKPVKAIIYTHHHDCHVNGAAAFADEHTEIIGHENLLSSMFSEWFGPVFPSRAEGGIKMGGILFLDAPVENGLGWYVGYGIAAPQYMGASGFIAPTKTVKETLKTTIAGVEIHLIPVAGETQDVLLVWLPHKRVLIEIAVLYEAFPAISTMRGSRQRDPLDYVNSLKIARSLNPEYLVALHGANPVTAGEDEVRQYLTNFSDAIQFVNDQTVQYLNKGLTAGEMKDLIVLPPHLANSPYLQQIYGSKDWNIFHIFRYYRGFYTGEVRDLFPQSTLSEAQMSVELAGGIDALAIKAEQARAAGKLEWALRFADDVLVLDPDHAAAFETKKAVMLALAAETMNSQARNMLLSDYLIMTEQAITPFTFGEPKAAFRTIDDTVLPSMPLDTVHRILAVQLSAAKAMAMQLDVGLQLTDIPKENSPKPATYTLEIRKGILEANPPAAGPAQFVIITDSLTWKKLVLGKIAPQVAIGEDMVVISGGSTQDFLDFMQLFE